MKAVIALSLAASVLAAGNVAAQSSLGWGAGNSVIDEYEAYIGPSDLRNSEGGRLTQAWQVLRQDRANYHRYRIRDRGDQGDSFFGSVENRAIMERLVRDGRIAPGAARAVLAGGVWVTVRVIGRGSVGHSVEVTVN